MSSRKDYRSDRSDRSSHRRESSPRRRSRRSESPVPPRAEKELPPMFGRFEKKGDIDDHLNVLQRMSHYTGPLELLKESLSNGKELKIWTRNFKEIRGICTGKLIAFDKHWNLVLEGVEEVFLKKKKAKTPFLREIKSDEVIPDIPKRVPRTKRSAAAPAEKKSSTAEGEVPAPDPVAPSEGGEKETPVGKKETPAGKKETPASEKETTASEKETSASEKETSASEKETPAGEKEAPAAENDKKKKKRKNRSRRSAAAADRQYKILFVRGDNIVMISYKDE